MTHTLVIPPRASVSQMLICRWAAIATIIGLLAAVPARAASLVPLATFGGGDGWREPFEILAGDTPGTDSQNPGVEYNYLQIGNLERGLAYNPTTGHLILVSRSAAGNGIRVLDGMTGVDIGALNQGSGVISGGTFTTDMIGIADDGAIYVGNLTTNTTGTPGPFKIYRWENEAAAAPTLAYSGAPLAGARLGDSLDVIGSGTSTQLVAGYYHTPAVAGNNSFALFDTSDGLNFTATHIDVASAPPNSGDFRLGITFQDADTVMGSHTDYRLVRIVDVAGSTGTLVSTFATEGAYLNPMDFAVVQDKPLLAVVATSDSRLFVYDITEPYDMVDPNPNIAVATATTFHTTNGNATGQVKFGTISDNVAILYALDTNNGIQAFTLTLDLVVVNSGDYNGDGFVDAADYVVWRDTEGQSVTPGSGADGDGDGTIGPGDYDYWKARFGNTAGSGELAGAAVPEPSAMLLSVVVACGFIAVAGRRFIGDRVERLPTW